MTASIEAITYPAVDNGFGKTSLVRNILSELRRLRSQVGGFVASLTKANSSQSNCIQKTEENSSHVREQRNTKAIQRNEKSQPHLTYAASATVDRLTPEKMIPSQILDHAARVLDEAIICHQCDDIVGARKSVTNFFTMMMMNQAQCFEFPSKYGLNVLDRGRKLFLVEGVSCSIKHGTLLLDSSANGAQFYAALLNVMGAFALLISEFNIAKATFDRLVDLHHQSNITSRSSDLASAYNNKGCVHLIMGDLREAEQALNTSLKCLGTSNGSSNVTRVFAVKSNMSRLNLVFREYRHALEQQEILAESCKATVMKEIPYPFEAVFTVMNNQAVLHTTLGKFDRAEQALWWLISYCKEINRKDSEYLVTFLRLHLSEVLILHGKSKAADEMFSIENLNSLEDIVKRFGNLYMNVRIEALEKLLELYIRRGKIRAALQLLQRTVKILKTVFGPDHFNIASLLYKQGKILSLTGEVFQAAEKFKISIEILRKIFGVKNFLLLKCYMSLGDVKSRLNQEEESYLYFQRATENIEAIYQVSFVDELRIKYLEITQSFNTFQNRKASNDRIEGLVAEYGQGVAFWLNHHSNCQLGTCRGNRKRFLVKNTEGPFSESTSVAYFKYSSDFIKSGQKLLRLGMINEAAVFFQYAELHSRVHVIQDYPDLSVAFLHSAFLEEKFRSHRVLQSESPSTGNRFRKLLEDLCSFIEESGPKRVVEKTNGVATTIEVDYQRNLRPVLILLLLFSIELKMTETTFVAYDLYSKLFQHETDFPFLLLDGMQVYASRAMITCNGQTAVQDIFVSSEIGLNERGTERASADTKLYSSLAYQENTNANAFLVTGRSPVLLDIEDLNTVKDKISLAVQECFQTKCMAAEANGSAMTVFVDLTPTAQCDLQDIFSMGSRIDLLPLCLSEHPSTGIPNKETIFEMDTSMYQTTTEVTFEDQQSSCFIFKKTALRLLQQNDPGRISSLALASHSLSMTVLHPRKTRIILSQSGERVTQKTQFVSTRKTITRLADPKATFEASVLDVLPLPEIHQTIEKYGVPCQQRTLSKIPLEQSATPCENNSSSNHGGTGTERSSQIYRGEIIGTSELEGRQEQPRENVLQCLRTISQISRTLYSVESPVTDNVICLTELSQRHDAYENQEDIPRKDKSSLLDLADDDSRRRAASFQNQEDQENTSGTLQHFTESSEENESNECLALNVPDITTVEASTCNHGNESILKEGVCVLEGKRLFEDDRKSRLSFIADLRKSLKDKPQKRPNPKRGDCIQSNRAESNDVSKLQSSHMRNCNLEVLYQNPEAQAPSPIPTFRNVSTHENSQRSSLLEGKTAKEDDKLMRMHPSPQSPPPNNVRDCNDLEGVSSRWPKTTLEKEVPFAAYDKSDGSSLLERKTYVENVETARNDIRSSTENTTKTNRETTSPNQEVQDTLRADEEGQRQTKPGVNNFKSRKQHSMEGSQRIEVEITGYGTKTPKNQETPCPDYDDKATWETFGSRAGEVLPDGSMNKETFKGQNNVVDVLNEKHIVDGPNLEEENGMYSVEKREPTIHSKSRVTISDCHETTTRFRCQGGDLVADGESHRNLAVDGSVLAKHSDKDDHAFVFISNHEVEDVGVDREGRRQTAPDISKFKITKQDVQGKERSGVEIIRRETNTPEKQGISCSNHNEMTTDRTFEALGSNQRNVIDLVTQRCFVDGPNLTEENRAQPLKQGSRAMDPISSYRKIHLKSQSTTSNRHETRTRSMCQGGDVVADGESIEDNLNNVDIVEGPALTRHPHKAFNGGESFTANIKHTSVTSGSRNESPTDRDALCEYRYLKSKTDLFQTHSDDGGARPKQRSTDNTKSPLPWPSVKNPFSAYCDFELENSDLDPRHVKESSQFPSFHYGGNYNYASLDGPWQENYEQEYSSSNAHDQVFKGKGQKTPEKKEFTPQDIAHKFKLSVPVYNASVTKNLSFHRVSPPNGDEKESWHFPSSESWEDRVPRIQCFSERTNESNPTSLPKSFDADCEKLFDACGSVCAYNDMDSMANEYSSSIANNEWGQSLPQNEDEHSSTEHSLATSFRYLQEIMAETIRLVVSKATGARETQPANQPVEKTGVQEETGDMGEEEPVITQQVNETNIRGESTPSNETTIEAERQPMATPVQESPRPVCSHYQRRCLVRFPCCGKFFPCHRCHNESDCSEDQARAINATHIRCTICYHEQEIDKNGQRCGGCNAIMSEYFCPICRHYTSMDKNPFHCEKCGICRIHRDRSFHCDVCNVCLDKRLEGKHKCRPDSGHDECCICLEDAFSGCQILPCSHKVHKDCAIAMIQNGVRKCPICRHPLFGQLQTSSQN